MPTRELLLPLVVWRLLLLLFIALTPQLFPNFNVGTYEKNFHWPPGASPSIATIFSTWDVQHYLHLVDEGYVPGSMSNAFYPLWPLLLKAASWILSPLVAGLLLANAFAVGAALLFHKVISRRFGDGIATWTVVAWMASPTAFYLALPYNEALFMVLVLGLVAALDTDRPWVAAVLGFLSALVRPQGLLLVPGIVVSAWLAGRPRAAAAAIGPVLGMAVYLLWMQVTLGSPWAGFETQGLYIVQPSAARLLDPVGFVATFFDVREAHAMLGSGLDRLLFVVFLAALPVVWRLEKSWVIWALPLGMVPAMTTQLMSFSRYFLIIFPVFLCAGWLLERAPQWRAVLLGASMLMQVLLLLRHISFNWVG